MERRFQYISSILLQIKYLYCTLVLICSWNWKVVSLRLSFKKLPVSKEGICISKHLKNLDFCGQYIRAVQFYVNISVLSKEYIFLWICFDCIIWRHKSNLIFFFVFSFRHTSAMTVMFTANFAVGTANILLRHHNFRAQIRATYINNMAVFKVYISRAPQQCPMCHLHHVETIKLHITDMLSRLMGTLPYSVDFLF